MPRTVSSVVTGYPLEAGSSRTDPAWSEESDMAYQEMHVRGIRQLRGAALERTLYYVCARMYRIETEDDAKKDEPTGRGPAAPF